MQKRAGRLVRNSKVAYIKTGKQALKNGIWTLSELPATERKFTGDGCFSFL